MDALNSNYCSVDGVLLNKSRTTLIQFPGGKSGSYTIPSGVTGLGTYAFNYCTNLVSLTIPNSVTNLGEATFYNCVSLTSAIIPNGITSIGNSTFQHCFSLTNVTIPNSVTNIGNSAFYYCTKLAGVTIPDNVTSIGYSAFPYCTSLTSMKIPNRVSSIRGFSFAYCTNLTSATIGDRVTNIESTAFYNCTSLTGLYSQGDAPSVGSDVFFNDSQAIIYYLPETTGWGATFGGRPTALWALPKPLILDFGPSFGMRTNQFGFIISWATNLPVLVEACTNLGNPVWSPLATNALTGGWSYFGDPHCINYPARFYRIRSP